MAYDPTTDDPTTSWAYIIGAVGCLLFVVSVFFANALYFDLDRVSMDRSAAAGPSILLRETWGAQQTLLMKSGSRLEVETEKNFPTQPIADAMKSVQSELQKNHGK